MSGQKLTNSPFSRFNLGSLEPGGSFRSLSMGGTGVGMRDNKSVYYSNPASYSSLDTNSFVFDFGADFGLNFLKDGKTQDVSGDLNFDHLMLGFPILKGFGFAAGIVTYSNGYYKIANQVTEGDPGYNSVTGEYTTYHAGDGGISNLFAGTGINLTKNISAGINFTFLFGSLSRSNQFIFADYYNVFNISNSESSRITGFNLDYGLQYHANLFKDYFVVAGASMNNARNYKTSWETLSTRYNAYDIVDTLIYELNNSSKSYLPGSLHFGLSFGKKNKFVAGVDYNFTKWSEAVIHESEGYLADTRSIMFGAEYVPDRLANYSLLKRTEYRLGGHIEDNYLIINGNQVKEYGFSFGLGVPMGNMMPRSISRANFYVDMTRKYGPAGSQIHRENYCTFGVSLNFYDFWFIKAKYD